MLEYIYEWMENIAFYMVLVTAVMHLLPDSDYQKYVRFFTGLTLVVLLLTPGVRAFRHRRRTEKYFTEPGL